MGIKYRIKSKKKSLYGGYASVIVMVIVTHFVPI